MNGVLLQAAAFVVVLTVGAHSYFGERRLIGPILAIYAPITQKPLARAVVRFAWHFTSALGIVIAVLLWRGGSQPSMADPIVIAVAGVALLASGLVDAVWSRFRHIGWPMLTLAGALILLSFL
jgi:di/tricarboxylate transporter